MDEAEIKETLEVARFESLEAAHLYESFYGDIDVAEGLVKLRLAIREIAMLAYKNRGSVPALSDAPHDESSFIRWICRHAQDLSQQTRYADKIHSMEKSALIAYTITV